MREIKTAVTLNESSGNETVYNAGLMLEHNTTKLIFELETALISPDYKYYLDFATPSGILRTDYLIPDADGAISYLLPAAVTSQMSVICCLNIVRINETTYKTEEVIKPKLVRLNFSTVEGDSKELANSYDFSVNAMLEAIKNGDFKGDKGEKGEKGAKGDKGDKGDTGTVVTDSVLNANSSNPIENQAVAAALSQKVDKINGKVLSSNDFTDEYKTVIENSEKTSNKVTEFSGTQTDTQYPSAKLVYDSFVASQEYIDSGLSQKVDKVSGKTLSSNDFTNTFKQKLNSIETGANKTVVDTAILETSSNPVENKAISAALSQKVDKINGKVLSSNDFTDSLKQKLNAIEAGATKTVVDTAISAASANPVENKAISAALSQKVDKASGKSLSSNDFTDSLKQKLDAIEAGATKTVVDTALSATSANPVENKAVKSELDKKLSLSGGTMAGNLGMGGKDILNVKKIIFISENGEWLNMGGHPITNLAAPTADHHAATKAYVDSASFGSQYTPVTLADITLTDAVSEFSVSTYNGNPFYCNEFTVQLDVPSTAAVAKIDCSVRRTGNTYQGVNSDIASIKTVTDSEKHTLAYFKGKFHNKAYVDFSFGGQQAGNNIKWSNTYNNVPLYANSLSGASFNEKGTAEIKIKLGSGSLPVGTIIKIWGEIIPQTV